MKKIEFTEEQISDLNSKLCQLALKKKYSEKLEWEEEFEDKLHFDDGRNIAYLSSIPDDKEFFQKYLGKETHKNNIYGDGIKVRVKACKGTILIERR